MPAALQPVSTTGMAPIDGSHQIYVPPAARQVPSAAYMPPTTAPGDCGGPFRGGGPISELQEFVQQDRRFPVSANRAILKWEWDTRMANAVTLQFRATVSFMHAGIPHHATGVWQSSKKAAQRDAAERVLAMLKNQQVVYDEGMALCNRPACSTQISAVDKLSAFCENLAGQQDAEFLQWSYTQHSAGWQATVEVCIYGDVLHTLQGAVCSSKEAAMEDTANRALWYFNAPSHVNAFEVSRDAVAQDSLDVPSSECWHREGLIAEADLYRSETQQRTAEQKTTLMRIQNQLQKRFGKEHPTGASVWKWSYDYSPMTEQNLTVIPLCRAKVWIPGLDMDFESQWHRGQKQAQLDVCAQVTEYLDAEGRNQINH
eukprot:gnl/MRDRNA2_/MRDRNA2_110310_c0_seq1.p1 gnl/MRDRNA2_/MRDRNA2_110310_c0~~gnl/MRDRNA2_/MRDRNA2_110310_c0_seq1.p1  ORF type:complete len:398 (+),score=73.99 gnl/MRDRNA2_/MRDRNA2_110310_c0_seq1:79-1194(+)